MSKHSQQAIKNTIGSIRWEKTKKRMPAYLTILAAGAMILLHQLGIVVMVAG